MQRLFTIFSALGLLLTALPASAWTPRTRVRMTEEAVRLMPASLRLALEGHRESLLRGMLAPMTEEDGPEHLPPWAEGRLDQSVRLEAERLGQALAGQTSFAEIAGHFGRLAHFVADAGFPPGAGDGGGPPRYEHFAGFCESRREKFPLVFHGYRKLDDLEEYSLEILNRARADDLELARIYETVGDPPAAYAFDDRSVSFAIASLSYSYTVTDIVRVWLTVWERAGGDTGRLPYRNED